MTSFGSELKMRRKKLGYTQELVARKIGVNQPDVSLVEGMDYASIIGNMCRKFYDEQERERAKEYMRQHPDVAQDPAVRRVVLTSIADELGDVDDQLGPAA